LNKVNELNCVKNIQFFINTSPVEAIQALTNSHFLITSRSYPSLTFNEQEYIISVLRDYLEQ
jgi:hypothetical protein